ncbi:MAG TPA: hypothetical protein VIJ92_04060 [Ginsengibacter sp.]
MNENLPYEDELKKRLSDLLLPAEDTAWEDMKQRLDKDDKDRPLIPPVFKGCAGYGILFLVIAIVSLFIIDPAKWFHNGSKQKHIKNDSIGNKMPVNKNDTIRTIPLQEDNSVSGSSLKDSSTLSQKGITYSTLLTDTSVDRRKVLNRESSDSTDHKKQNKNFTKTTNTIPRRQEYNTDTKKTHEIDHVVKKIPGRLEANSNGNAETNSVVDENINQSDKHQPDSLKPDTANVTLKKVVKIDSSKKNNKDTIAKKSVSKIDSVKQKHIYFGAGLALHQLIPIAGQKSNPYNSLGRKSSLRDYIPSVYLRLYNNKKWFIQSEFRYGAPQYTKDIVFVPKKIIDTSFSIVTSESKTVKKTFYHQLPVSFNYFVLPGLSAGAGVTFNKFSSAIVQQNVNKSNTITLIDSLVSSDLVTQKKADSNFVKTYMQALFEIQYQWKRLSAGVRYSFGLQPYLEFALPGGIQGKEKNSSLQIFIRYELWQSRRKE